LIRVAEEVRAALDESRAVVALESTIVAHGLPWPASLEIGRALEAEVRAAGAVPATIAVLGGECCVGLGAEELERVARGGRQMPKAAAADLGVHVARGGNAATTVSATTWIAARVGIKVFATGGIGGVHRGDAGDVSSDLTVMAREPVAVVSAGAKAILDLPRTVETLETLGVLVLGYGTDELPAFYTRKSGVPLDHRVDSPAEAAAVCAARWALGQAGVLVANPIPADAELDAERIGAAVSAALERAEREGVRGKALTPFLLAELATTTGGEAVRANRALALANAKLAAEIAASFPRTLG
jgi:pseudouridine-5'-phosphate glycosidase